MNKLTTIIRPHKNLTCVALSIANLLALPASAFAAPITVVDGGCTLKDAIISANDNTATGDCPKGDPDLIATDFITLPDNSMQSLSVGHLNNTDYFTGLPFVTSNIIIHGEHSTLRRDSTDPFRLIAVTGSGNLTINDLTIENGSLSYNGGGVFVGPNAELTLNNSTVAGNTAALGALYTGNGGGLFTNGGTITLNSSTVSGNSAIRGGGIYAEYSNNITLTNTTVSRNYATSRGGGIQVRSSITKMTNSTVSGNVASTGGGIYTLSGNLSLYNSTVSGNFATTGGGIHLYFAATASLSNSIIANSSNNDDVVRKNFFATLISDTASIIEEASYDGSRTGDPGLFSLADNGGPTKTHALRANSIARDTGILGNCTAYDQRDQIRDDGDGKCDVGAIEFNEDDVINNDETSFIVIPLGNGKAAVIPN